MLKIHKTYILLYSIYILFDTYDLCRINGYDSGECTDPSDFDLLLPFCKSVIPYQACLPRYQSLWYNHSSLSKDTWIKQMFYKITINRKLIEKNVTLIDKGLNEWGEPGEIVPRFTDNLDCENAFKNYFCWLNFPRCDVEGRSLLMCRSVCENFFKACQQPKDLWRCGDPKYVNGYEPEVSTVQVNGKLLYFRYPFPGSPFRDNSFDPDTNKPNIVCTPSIENDSKRNSFPFKILFICIQFMFYLIYFHL